MHRSIALAVVGATLFLGALSAEAKVPIPCTGDKIVKVAEMPKTPAFKTPSGQQVDLGYLYEGCFKGKWVGYVGSSRRFVTWPQGVLPVLITGAGLSGVPEPPGIMWGLWHAPGQFLAEWIWIAVVACLAAAVTINARQSLTPEPSAALEPTAAPEARRTAQLA